VVDFGFEVLTVMNVKKKKDTVPGLYRHVVRKQPNVSEEHTESIFSVTPSSADVLLDLLFDN
jgi:hypothetical protein